jgi:hypothetical protein
MRAEELSIYQVLAKTDFAKKAAILTCIWHCADQIATLQRFCIKRTLVPLPYSDIRNRALAWWQNCNLKHKSDGKFYPIFLCQGYGAVTSYLDWNGGGRKRKLAQFLANSNSLVISR